MEIHFSTRSHSLFPLSAKSFIHAKAEAFDRANARAANNGKNPSKGLTPSIDMSCVKFFSPLDEVNTQKYPWAPSAMDKIRRAAQETFEQSRKKTASEKARQERIAQAQQENKEHFARKRAEEAECEARKQAIMAERKARSMITRAALEAPGKRKPNPVNRMGAASHKLPTPQSSNPSSPSIDGCNNSNGKEQTVNVDVTRGTRIFHGKARHRPMVIDSDDEKDLLPSPKHRGASNITRPKQGVDEKGKEGSNSSLDSGCNDSQSAKRKWDDDHDDDDSDPSDDERLDHKRRKYQHVRSESNKENMPTKTSPRVITKAAIEGTNNFESRH